MSRAPRWGYTGLLLGVTTALGVWLLHQAGWLASWDGVFYDRLLSWTTRWRDPTPRVLLLRTDREEVWSDGEALTTLTVLDELGARAIVYDFLPLRGSREFFERAAELKKVVFGRALQPDPENPDTLRLDPWPATARDMDLPWGVVFLPPSLKGVHRWHQATVTAGTNSFPTLERRVADICDPGTPPPPEDGLFLVNFVGGPGSIPNVSLSRLVAGDLIREMVEGRVVLVGAGDGLLGLETPVCGGARPMSFLEFQGNALQTLLDRTPIRPLPWIWTLLLLVGLGMFSSLLYQRVTSVAGARLVLGVLAVCALGAVAGLWFPRVWLPLGAVVLAQAGQFALTLVFKTRMTHRALNEMRLHALNQIKERVCPQDVALAPDYWDHVVSMLDQVLEIRRMVFLERLPQTQKLLESKAVHCRFEDLRARERSMDAPLFAPALAKGAPVQVTGMFAEEGESEVEYLCPLVFAGQVWGVWLVGLDETKPSALPQVELLLARFSQQIARLLYHRKRAAPRRTRLARLKTWFSAEKEDLAYQELKSTADLIEQYYDTLEAVLSQVGTAMIVYDFFGRVLKVNEPALALFRAENVAPARATALDFIGRVTGRTESQVRSLLRNVLLDNSPASMSVKLASQGERQFLLRVYPLSEPSRARLAQDPFRVRGIVCELIETTSLSTLASLKGVVADRLGVELRDHLAAIQMSAALLETDQLATSDRQSVLEAIHQKTKTCVQVISECQTYLGRSVDAYAIDCFPLDALDVLGRVCSGFTAKAAERRITLEVKQPRLMDQVLASTSDLERLLSCIVDLLLADAAESTTVTIAVEDGTDFSTFRFSNCGFGIPNERLQRVLTAAEIPTSEEFRTLRDALVWVRNWDGSLEITSEVGKGYNVVLRLRQFKLASFLPPQSA